MLGAGRLERCTAPRQNSPLQGSEFLLRFGHRFVRVRADGVDGKRAAVGARECTRCAPSAHFAGGLLPCTSCVPAQGEGWDSPRPGRPCIMRQPEIHAANGVPVLRLQYEWDVGADWAELPAPMGLDNKMFPLSLVVTASSSSA